MEFSIEKELIERNFENDPFLPQYVSSLFTSKCAIANNSEDLSNRLLFRSLLIHAQLNSICKQAELVFILISIK